MSEHCPCQDCIIVKNLERNPNSSIAQSNLLKCRTLADPKLDLESFPCVKKNLWKQVTVKAYKPPYTSDQRGRKTGRDFFWARGRIVE